MGVMNEDRLTLYDGLIKTHITNTTVAKETGKGLSTEDYTTDEKKKLDGIGVATNSKTGLVKPDGDTITVDQDGTIRGQSKVDEMTGATAEANGTSGTVPAPKAGQENHVLKGNGAWEAITYDSELSAESENAPQTKVVEARAREIETNLAQLSNPNLLINPDFKINQRGGKISLQGTTLYTDADCTINGGTQTEEVIQLTKLSNGNYLFKNSYDYTWYVKASDVVDGYCEDGVYTIDRWRKHINGYTKLVYNGVEISTDLYQYLEYPERYLGKTVTLSAKIDGVVKSKTATLPNEFTESAQFPIGIEYENANLILIVEDSNSRIIQGCNISPRNNKAIIVNWVKLELGSVATPFVPPYPATELVKCGIPYDNVLGYKPNILHNLVNTDTTPTVDNSINWIYA